MAKYVLGKKQSAKNEDFLNVWNNIEQLVSREEAERLVASAVSDIRSKTAGKRVAYAWSGGKDSLALQVVCERAGINQCVLCTASKIEYPGFVDWCKANGPKGLTIVDNPALDVKYVADHPEMYAGYRPAKQLYPRCTSKVTQKTWHKMYQLLIAGDPKRRSYRVIIGDICHDNTK